ncbi:hypothetical protein QTP81_13995 [Alteromonas sp. ASW11-36]|uniref:Uncharacterized protein n=1 Tax=Alteromonas arenosi TaxID=3055817 RepID=A0ABT7T0C8_9ALTE|nr:hypothetical protein [Alteromonas sp. ASW11-36]MDM7861709.1 hypothetical protein [Alteromonas sp. ASW11-36]
MNFNPKFQQRERDYRFVQVPFNQIRIVDTHDQQRAAKLAGNHVKLWICESLEVHPASAEYPVYQSYIDTCVGGCLSHPQSATAGIEQAEQFLRTTFGWQYIVNDRDKPQYPRFAPLSSLGKQTIDALMNRHGIDGS